jgi:hypothetical protein
MRFTHYHREADYSWFCAAAMVDETLIAKPKLVTHEIARLVVTYTLPG